MDLTGIENEAEFFPAGTLSDVLEVELQDITGRWSRELEGANPVTRLSGSADTYLRLYRQLLNTTDKNLRNELYSQSMALVSTALGYDVKRTSEMLALDAGSLARVMNKTFDADGKQVLWIIEAPVPAPGEEQADPLGQTFEREQYDGDEQEHAELEKAIEEFLADGIFGLPDAPRYVLVAGASQWVLVDQRKWPARSVLRFDLQEIFSRQDRGTFRVMACLVAREARVPATGIPIADRLEEEAQRNANAVTTSLKRTVRDAIEILGQEVLDVTGGKFLTGPKRGVWVDGPTLSLECLRYMYRLLFLLYAESSPRLRILDLKDPLYASGYSMEALRDLESVRLRTPQEKNGTYLWDSLQQVLTLLYSGENQVLQLPAVKVSLLNPESTPLLNSVSLRNEAVQKIIRQLSLRSSTKNTGRISYSKLGIGQLGAVYETLISFTGTVAKEDLIELKGDSKDRAAAETSATDDTGHDAHNAEVDEEVESRMDKVDLLAPTYFVPRRRIAEFNPEAVVFEGTRAKIYQKGSFTYRLSGRDREKTAAYYTPEPLARLLVKHLLMERCKDLAADEILELKILEPAMGSAAFLVETTNQLTDLYLERKQVEVGRMIPQDEILLEKQKVRSCIADRNCFGVDLNPTAVELGAISLWLNGLHKSDFSPWFGDQLHAGNSLIGARRAVYPESQLIGRSADLWFKCPPKEIGWKEKRPENTVYQWLLPAVDMAAFEKDMTIKEFAGEHQARIKAWRAGGFFKPLEPHEVNLVKRLTTVADELFEIVASEIARTRGAANDEITLWPDKTMSGAKGVGYQKKEILKQRLLGEDHAENTLPFKRLKTAMDAWCALWLWPIEKADKLPSRQEFLEGMRILLEGGFSVDGSLSAGAEDDFAVIAGDLFDQQLAESTAKYNTGLFQETNVEAFIEEYDWLQVATEVANEVRFVHHDLIFADILNARGGFDLIVGNPPWKIPRTIIADLLADLDPKFFGLTANKAQTALADIAKIEGNRKVILSRISLEKGSKKFIASEVQYPLASSSSSNLYRAFIELSFNLLSDNGAAGLIHQDGHLSTPSLDRLRRVWYKRIRKSFEFLNKITEKNFSEVRDGKRFSLNIYSDYRKNISFEKMTGCLLASQVEESFLHDGVSGSVSERVGKNWNTSGHKARIVAIDQAYISAISTLQSSYENENPPFIHPKNSYQSSVIEKIASKSGAKGAYDEIIYSFGPGLKDILRNNLVTEELNWPDGNGYFIYTSPSMGLANILAKCPRKNATNYQHYDPIVSIKNNGSYRPRTLLKINNSEALISEFFSEKGANSTRHFDSYRFCWRKRVDPSAARTFTGAIIAPSYLHHTQLISASFRKDKDLLNFSAIMLSLMCDFILKSLLTESVLFSNLTKIPYVKIPRHGLHRVLLLSSVSKDFTDLLNGNKDFISSVEWSSNNVRKRNIEKINSILVNNGHVFLTASERRQALLELDVIVAIEFGLSLDDFLSAVDLFELDMRNDQSTYFDDRGNIVYTEANGYQRVGYLLDNGKPLSRKQWEVILLEKPNLLVSKSIPDYLTDDESSVESSFIAPFANCDKKQDYKQAWRYFEKLGQEGTL